MTARRFAAYATSDPELLYGLAPDHPAVVDGRTMFPGRVVSASESPRLLIDGHNQRKIGRRIAKGAWKGLRVYTLTLEERATCPRSCAVWARCYGNAMHWPRRHRHGPDLESRLALEVADLASRHRGEGFAIRLHVLGDFYSLDYVALWDALLRIHGGLHLFGFTAHAQNSPEGQRIAAMNGRHPGRCMIRFSQAAPGPMAAVVVDSARTVPAGAVICPAQTGGTDCCATCGLCWSPAFAPKTVAFLRHGAIRPWSQRERTGPNPGHVYPGTGRILKRAGTEAAPQRKRGGRKPMSGREPGEAAVLIATTVGIGLKAKFAAVAARQGITPASLLRRLVEQSVQEGAP